MWRLQNLNGFCLQQEMTYLWNFSKLNMCCVILLTKRWPDTCVTFEIIISCQKDQILLKSMASKAKKLHKQNVYEYNPRQNGSSVITTCGKSTFRQSFTDKRWQLRTTAISFVFKRQLSKSVFPIQTLRSSWRFCWLNKFFWKECTNNRVWIRVSLQVG